MKPAWLLLTALLIGAPVMADKASDSQFKTMDANGDGRLTPEEYAEHVAGSRAMFEKMDANRDGFLSRKELADGHSGMLQKPAK